MAFQVSVCGPRFCTEDDEVNARKVGELLAASGVVVICGGGKGVMAAVAAGVRSANGIVIGIRPNDSQEGATPDLTATIVTNMGEARNAIIVWSADAVISIGGSWGTLSEVALAMRKGDVPVIAIGGWNITNKDGQPIDGVQSAATAEEAVSMATAGKSD